MVELNRNRTKNKGSPCYFFDEPNDELSLFRLLVQPMSSLPLLSLYVTGGDCEVAVGVWTADIAEAIVDGVVGLLLQTPPCRPSKLALSCPAAT